MYVLSEKVETSIQLQKIMLFDGIASSIHEPVLSVAEMQCMRKEGKPAEKLVELNSKEMKAIDKISYLRI